jgi:hypothetical protein
MIFIGASPILEEEILELKKKRANYFILASDTSCYFMYKNDLLPDAILSIDSGRGTAYHFRNDFPQEIPIFTWLGGNKEIFLRKNPIYLLFTSYPLDQLFSNYLQEFMILKNSSLNISGMAMSIAESMDILDFGFSGISFSSFNSKSHCRATGYESYMLPQIYRTKTMEMYSPGNYKTIISKKNQIATDTLKNSKYNYKNFKEVKPSIKFDFSINKSMIINKDLKYFFKIINQENIINQLSAEIEIQPKLIKKYLKSLL